MTTAEIIPAFDVPDGSADGLPPEMNPPWTEEDMDAAAAEHWDIFSCSRHPSTEREPMHDGYEYGSRPWEINSIDEHDAFPDGDTGAWRVVLRGAAEGKQHCVNALAFLMVHSPNEYAAWMRAAQRGEFA